MDEGEDFGPWLGRQLRRMGMSQAELANSLGMTRAAVSAWITGRAEPREETKRAIAEVLGTDAASVYNRTVDVVVDKPIAWYHRPAHADGGREFGNAAAFAFDADMRVLAREATQNSLDERERGNSRPVRVRYTLHRLTGEHRENFLAALRWGDLQSHYRAAASSKQKVGKALAETLREIDENKPLLLLRVDDYNATGLTGPEYGDGRFAAVVRRQLDSLKSSERAGGSYGLGKATLWATSKLGLVLINSTLSEPFEGRTERRVVGRLDLPWREVDGVAFAGPAWLGEPDTEPGYEGVSRSWWADEETVRNLHLDRANAEPGTSFLIVGAHDASSDTESLSDMHNQLVSALADNFWAAMTGGQATSALLEASVTTLENGIVLISEETVDPSTHHPALTRALRAYLNGETVAELTSGEQVASTDVPLLVPPLLGAGIGKGTEHKAVLLVTPAADGDQQHSRLVCMRGSRMSIVKDRPRDIPLGTEPFQAVLLAGFATTRDGADVALAEDFLRAAEPPEHDRWVRTEELATTYARGALTRLNEFRSEMDAAVRRLVGRREAGTGSGPAVLKELLRLDAPATAARRSEGHPTIRNLDGTLDATGAWRVRVEIKVPPREDPWLLTPVAKFDVRSGGRPTLGWAELGAGENCRIENGNLAIEPGARSASFTGVTEVGSHPVAATLARLVIDLQKARGVSG